MLGKAVVHSTAEKKAIDLLVEFLRDKELTNTTTEFKPLENLKHALYKNYTLMPDFVLQCSLCHPLVEKKDVLDALSLPSGEKLANLAIQLMILRSVFEGSDYYRGINYSLALFGLLNLAVPSLESVLQTLRFDMAMIGRVNAFATELKNGFRPKGLQGLAADYCVKQILKNEGVVDHAAAVAVLALEKANTFERLTNGARN